MAVKIGQKHDERDRSRHRITDSSDDPDLFLTLPRGLDLPPGRGARAQELPGQKHIGDCLLSDWPAVCGHDSCSIGRKDKMTVDWARLFRRQCRFRRIDPTPGSNLCHLIEENHWLTRRSLA